VNFSAPCARWSVTAIACAMAALSAGQAWADEDNTPLSLSLTHDITRDSNFGRTTERQGETINTTGVRLGLNKSYGRQQYQLTTGLNRVRYAHFGQQLNNEGKDFNGAVRSEFGSNWIATVGGIFSQNLNPIQNNTVNNRVVRNIRKYRDGNAALQYGNGGRWSLTGTYDTNRLTYSDAAYVTNNADQYSTGLRANYYSSDVLNFGLGVRNVHTQFPNQTGLKQDDRDIDLSTNWQVTGLSSLSAVLTRRSSDFNTSTRGGRGYSGQLNWQYTPSGLITYGVGLSRTSGTDRTQNSVSNFKVGAIAIPTGTADVNNNNTTTSLNLSARMQLTGKITAGLRHSFNRYGVDSSTNTNDIQSQFTNQVSTNTHSIYRETALNVDYAMLRSLSLGCTVAMYSQTQDSTRPRYDGRTMGCNANFTLDSF
jgi:hypothetical protein